MSAHAIQNLTFHQQCGKRFARTHSASQSLFMAQPVARYWIKYTWAREPLMMLRRQMSKEMTQVHHNLQRAISTFLPSFKHAACSLFHTRESQSFAKALSFKSALKMPTESINAALSTNSLVFFTHCHVPGHQYHCIMFNERPVNETKNIHFLSH